MSVATRNPFSVLDENPSRPPTPPPPTKSEAPAPPPQSQSTRGRGRGGPASRGGRYYPRGGAAPASSTPTTEDQPAPEGKQPRRPTDGERKEGGRGRGRGGGGGRGRGRPFDRHSATGKTDSDKKVHNSWGGDDGETERKVEEAATIDAAAEDATAGGLNNWAAPSDDAAAADAWGAAPPADDTPATDGAEKPQAGDRRERRGDKEEEEDNTLTLDQYLAQQREKENPLIPKLEVRKVEGDLFKDAAPLKKDEDDEYFAGKAKSAPKPRAKKEEKVFIEIEARFDRPNRGRGGRGGDRGGDRGRGGGERGRGRGGRGRGRVTTNGTPAVNVDDETAFPSLS